MINTPATIRTDATVPVDPLKGPEHMSEHRRPIVACFDGSSHATGAVAWAARSARIHRLPMSIIRVVEPSASDIEINFAAATLREQLALVAANEPNVPLGARLIRGHVVDELVHLSSTAQVLVLGINRDMSRPSHGMLGPVEDRLVTHSACPVAIVPTRIPSPTPPPRVVVGWTPGSPAAETALTVAVGEAQVRGANLEVVALDESTAISARTLAEQAAGAELLVVGCHHDESPWAIAIGPIPLELSRTAPCPLILTPAAPLSSDHRAEHGKRAGQESHVGTKDSSTRDQSLCPPAIICESLET